MYTTTSFRDGYASKDALTFELHAHLQALLEAAERAAFALRLIDVAATLRHARVHLLILDGTLEEAFARFAGKQTVMVTGNFVAAHRAQLLDALLGVRQVGRGRRLIGTNTVVLLLLLLLLADALRRVADHASATHRHLHAGAISCTCARKQIRSIDIIKIVAHHVVGRGRLGLVVLLLLGRRGLLRRRLLLLRRLLMMLLRRHAVYRVQRWRFVERRGRADAG